MRGLRYLVLLILCCSASMLLSFWAVRYFARATSPSGPPPPGAIHRAQVLRHFANELFSLSQEFSRRTSRNEFEVSDSFTDWAEKDFRPRLNDLRERMLSADVSGEALGQLLASSDRLAGVLARAGRKDLRLAVEASVLEAVRATEWEVRGTVPEAYLSEASLLPSVEPAPNTP